MPKGMTKIYPKMTTIQSQKTMQIVKEPPFKKSRSSRKVVMTKGKAKELHRIVRQMPVKKMTRFTSKSQVGSATGEKRELKRKPRRQSSRGGSRR
jgi:hypothetical protein